jgi:hypothetical protein
MPPFISPDSRADSSIRASFRFHCHFHAAAFFAAYAFIDYLAAASWLTLKPLRFRRRFSLRHAILPSGCQPL